MVNRYITLINLLLITAISGVGVHTAYGIAVGWMQSARQERVEVARKVKAKAALPQRRGISHYDPVVDRNVFKLERAGEAVKKVETIDVDSLKQTSLKLKLWGTVSGDREVSFAIIEDPATRKQNLYRVGDDVEDAELKMILRNKVVFTVNGKDEVLEVGSGRGKKGRGRRGDVTTARKGRSTSVSLDRSVIDDSLKDINSLMKDVRVRPHFKDGVADGLSISGIRSDSIFKKMGLRNGDVIVGVDGEKIESVDDAMKLYGSLKDASGLKLQIKRRGRLQDIDFEIK